jgi:hypothetical protein
MYSVRAFFSLWSLTSGVILAYAFADLGLHPALRRETNFSMQPDIHRVGELVHWGGRLLKEGHWSLLVCNALVIGGVLALVLAGIVRRFRHERQDAAKAEHGARPSLP